MLRQRRTNETNGCIDTAIEQKQEQQAKFESNETKKTSPSFVRRFITGLLIFLVTIQVVIPCIYRAVPSIRQRLLFMNFFNIQFYLNVTNPETEYGLNCTRVLRIESEPQVEVGIWHILPLSSLSRCQNGSNKLDELEAFADDRPVFLYFHGNGGTRGGTHRLNLYRILSYTKELDAHIVTVDYRGYGDSTNVMPSAPGITTDAFAVYRWLIERVGPKRVNIWGHSMGTGVSVQMLSLIDSKDLPNTLTLEAPFNTIFDAVSHYPLAKIFFLNPFFEQLIVEPMRNSPLTYFNSEKIINRIPIPILILHAKDDFIVPFELGQRLFQKALEGKRKPGFEPKMIAYDEDKGYGHKHIWKDPKLPQRLHKFITSYQI